MFWLYAFWLLLFVITIVIMLTPARILGFFMMGIIALVFWEITIQVAFWAFLAVVGCIVYTMLDEHLENKIKDQYK